jgi:hypothetical protein
VLDGEAHLEALPEESAAAPEAPAPGKITLF